ncbi:MAG: ComEC/Rec2 family competence protein [Pararhodobacter sp.]|nr:ComEC/Rec2 family competence protein [Pararhodobacter sp.]
MPLLALAAARGRLFPFAPVFLGIGIGLYFSLPSEPGATGFGMLAFLATGAGLAGITGPERLRPLFIAVMLVAAGVLVAGWRTHASAAPVLSWRYYGPIEGRIIAVDRSVSDALRLTLDQVVLHDVSVARLPHRVRVSLHGGPPDIAPLPGLRVVLTGHLAPPGGPVEPGGFDFRRHAWFDQLGAVGYTRNPVLAIAPPEPGPELAIARLRLRMSAALQARLPGEPGSFVAAILTGDRSAISQETTEALRRSNLAHLLAISGLHMGLLTGTVYGALRLMLALIPGLALRLPVRKLAALGALAAATCYLLLSGGNVATQRAFVMAAVMLGAVLTDRRAISLHSVALAALVILMWRPEALLSPGFQMSFAATAALVAVFAALRDRRRASGTRRARPTPLRRVLFGLGSVALCSLVAGTATAPVAAAHFNRIAEYGLLANILSVPLMGTLVMPAAVLAAVLWPLGLEGAGLWLMQLGVRWILGVAQWVAGFEGAVRAVSAPPAWVLPGIALGMLWLILWTGRARLAGALFAAACLAGWGQANRPALLIAESGALIGLMGPEGRVLSRPRGEGFTARNWLEADGDMASQADAHARPGPDGHPLGERFDLGGLGFVHLAGRGAENRLAAVCTEGIVVILAARLPDRRDATHAMPCHIIDQRALAESGALAISLSGERISWRRARDTAGHRPWTGRWRNQHGG